MDDNRDYRDDASLPEDGDNMGLGIFDEPEEGVEPFVPTDIYGGAVKKKRRKTRRVARPFIAALIILGVVLLCVGAAFAYTVLNNPGSLFEGNVGITPTPDMQQIEALEPGATPSPSPTPTIDPYQVIYEQADVTMMQNIVNVLLIGVDYAEERETWNGKHDYHADVMMVMAINFDENRVDLISLPRDTYANIPGVKGIYKLNASLNCGGGFEAEGGAGFLKVCEATSWMLGGIPVNYYYAVTMPAVKQLVDVIGGVDYNLELSFSMAGRDYNAGPQHLSGQGVLDYLRVRKNVQGAGDLNRINRQKKMMIALFESMQSQNLILKIPEMINSFSGQLFTNCTLSQTAALTAFAYNLSSENIGMYSMSGTLTNIFNWNFCLTDETNRVSVIKNVYGVDVNKHLEYTKEYAQYRWADIIATQYLDTTEGLTSYVSGLLAADDLLPTASPTPSESPEVFDTPVPTIAPVETPVPTAAVTNTPETIDTPDPNAGTAAAGGGFSIVRLKAGATMNEGEQVQRYSAYQRELFNQYLQSLDDLEHAQSTARKEAKRYAEGKSNSLAQVRQDVSDYASHVKTNALQVAQEFGYSTSKFEWSYRYDLDRSFNEVYVDFR